MRRLLALSFLISLASTACVVGDQTPGLPDRGAAPDAHGDQTPALDGGVGADASCEPASAVIPDGHHNPGQDCLTCHNGTVTGAPQWTLAGTLYDSVTGINPVSGGTIIVTDGGGASFKLVSADNGNFYTGRAIQFPVTITASRCPDSQAMPQAQQVGDCNSCHGAASRVHLP